MTSDDISRYVRQLESDLSKRDKTIINLLGQMEAQAEFVRLMEPYMTAQEANYDVLIESMQELVRAYRRARGGAE